MAKHKLPVRQCSWAHNGHLDYDRSSVCVFSDGREPANYDDLWLCMEEAKCVIETEGERQMAVLRDPRAVIVSTFYYAGAYHEVDANGNPVFTLDSFVLRYLPVIAQWTAVRYILFTGYLAKESTIFWYEDAIDDPRTWHLRLLASIGLRLPEEVIRRAVDAALDGDFIFKVKSIDHHKGRDENMTARSFDNILREETLEEAEAILRTWLPPPLLARLQIPPP